MMLEAMTALLSLPRVISHRLSRSRMTVTRKRFSCSSTMLPLMDPMAQHSVFRAPQLHSMPFSCAAKGGSAEIPGLWRALEYAESRFLVHLQCRRSGCPGGASAACPSCTVGL